MIIQVSRAAQRVALVVILFVNFTFHLVSSVVNDLKYPAAFASLLKQRGVSLGWLTAILAWSLAWACYAADGEQALQVANEANDRMKSIETLKVEWVVTTSQFDEKPVTTSRSFILYKDTHLYDWLIDQRTKRRTLRRFSSSKNVEIELHLTEKRINAEFPECIVRQTNTSGLWETAPIIWLARWPNKSFSSIEGGPLWAFPSLVETGRTKQINGVECHLFTAELPAENPRCQFEFWVSPAMAWNVIEFRCTRQDRLSMKMDIRYQADEAGHMELSEWTVENYDRKGKLWLSQVSKVTSTALNKGVAKKDLKLDLPDGTILHDQVNGGVYRVSGDGNLKTFVPLNDKEEELRYEDLDLQWLLRV